MARYGIGRDFAALTIGNRADGAYRQGRIEPNVQAIRCLANGLDALLAFVLVVRWQGMERAGRRVMQITFSGHLARWKRAP